MGCCAMRRLLPRLTLVCSVVLLCYSFSVIRGQVTFENTLDALTLSFDNFRPFVRSSPH